MTDITEIILYILTAIMIGAVSYFTLRYFLLLTTVKDFSRKSAEFKPVMVSSAANGIVGFLCVLNFQGVYVMLIISVMITIESCLMIKLTADDISLAVIFLSSTLLNISCMYIIVYSLGVIICSLFKVFLPDFYMIIFCLAALCATLLVRFMALPGIFPNDALSEIITKSKNRILIVIYFSVFSVVNIVSLFCFVPVASGISMSRTDLILLFADSYLKASLVLFSSFFLVYYICKFSGSEILAVSLENKLKQESSYRKSILSDAIVSYCIDLDDDCVLEGDEYFKNALKNDVSLSCHKVFTDLCSRFIHPDDFHLVKPFLHRDTILEAMENDSISVIEIRVLDDVLRAFARKDIDYIKNLLFETAPQNFQDTEEPVWSWIETRYSLTKDESDEHNILYCVVSDIRERIEEEQLLKEAAEHDALTGLYNRAYLIKNINERLNRGENISVFMIDADHLKQVNDYIDHAAGDRMLLNVATILKNEFSPDDTVARLGGDEFVVVTNSSQNLKKLQQRARQLNAMARLNYSAPNGARIATSISIGIAVSPLHGKTPEELMENADCALYYVKNSTRNGYKIYDSNLRS